VTHKFGKYLILAIGALGLSALPAFATGCDAGIVLVNAPPAGTPATVCTLGALTFTWEELSYDPSAGTLNLITPFTGVTGGDYSLDFQFNGANADDVLMTYEVSSTSDNISQVDSSFQGIVTTGASILEQVCGVDPALHGGACPTVDVLATYSNLTGGLTFSSTFGPESNIWITKDIQVGTPSISTFTDSVVATPEPSSIGLLLMAGFGIVAASRKFRRA